MLIGVSGTASSIYHRIGAGAETRYEARAYAATKVERGRISRPFCPKPNTYLNCYIWIRSCDRDFLFMYHDDKRTDGMLSGACHTLLMNLPTLAGGCMKNLINWFEIPVTIMARAIAFYEQSDAEKYRYVRGSHGWGGPGRKPYAEPGPGGR